ncbi:unnamed protein product [Allacma fusca]|uniref:Uncharacterized protein n=1 Tax=Allacma fusca TaxID=39272 RepID=A0A8J2J7P4_9HEXA|nr:unnamed protein product [Allacma fusca]
MAGAVISLSCKKFSKLNELITGALQLEDEEDKYLTIWTRSKDSLKWNVQLHCCKEVPDSGSLLLAVANF